MKDSILTLEMIKAVCEEHGDDGKSIAVDPRFGETPGEASQ